LAASLFSIGAWQCALAQDPNSDVAATNKTDAVAYRFLFRQVVAYKKLSDDGKAMHQDRSYMMRTLARRLSIGKEDLDNLERIATSCVAEIVPIQTKIANAVSDFHAEYSQMRLTGLKAASPPSTLSDLQAQEDAIVLRYRDSLRNSMNEAKFQKAQQKIRMTFGRSQIKSTAARTGTR
jgi:hypothetical protein